MKSGLAVLLLAACAQGTLACAETRGQVALDAQPRVVVPEPETEVIRLRPGQLPEVTLSADILYRLLASEIAAQRGSYGTAANTMLDLARDTSDPRLARRALEFYLAGGNLPGALDAARRWAALAPDDAEASSTELALSAAAGQTRGLATALRARIDASPDKTAGIAQAMAVLSRMSDRKAALAILDEALVGNVRRLPAAHMALADAARAAGDSERALSEARAALAADPASEEAAQRVLEYGLRVDPAAALSEARAFAQRNPDARRLRLMLASQLADQGDYDAALAELSAMSRRSPEDFDLLLMQAQIQYRAGRMAQARVLLEQYIDVQGQRESAAAPGSTDAGVAMADAYLMLSRIAENEGRLDEAIALLGRIEDPVARHSARMRQAVLRARQGNVQEALAMIRSAGAQDDEETILGLLTTAQILRDAGRVDEAVGELAKADAQYPDTTEIKYELAMLHERQGDIDAMEQLLREIIALDPGHAHAYNALGYTLADRNERLPEALALITRALALMPDDPFILDSMGWVQFRLGENGKAIDYLRRAYAQRPEAEIAAHLGEVLWAAGQRDEARAMLREAVAKDADNRTVRDTLRRLRVSP